MKINYVFASFAAVISVGLLVLIGLGKIPYAIALGFIGGTLLPVIQIKSEDKKNESSNSEDSSKGN